MNKEGRGSKIPLFFSMAGKTIAIPLYYGSDKILKLFLPGDKIADLSSYPDPTSMGTTLHYTVKVRRGLYVAHDPTLTPEQHVHEMTKQINRDAEAIIRAAERLNIEEKETIIEVSL
jgi:hypothetical protein